MNEVEQKRKIIIPISICVCVIILLLGVIAWNGYQSYQVKIALENLQLLMKETLAESEGYADKGDFDKAIALLTALPDYESDEKVVRAIENYKIRKTVSQVDVQLTEAFVSGPNQLVGINSDQYVWGCYFTNNTGKVIKGLEITAIFTDSSGKEILKAKCRFMMDGISISEGYGEAFNINVSSDTSTKLKSGDIKFSYIINEVTLEDGTIIKIIKSDAENADRTGITVTPNSGNTINSSLGNESGTSESSQQKEETNVNNSSQNVGSNSSAGSGESNNSSEGENTSKDEKTSDAELDWGRVF